MQPTGQFFMDAKLFIRTLRCKTRRSSMKINLFGISEKCMVSMATPGGFEDVGMPTKLLVAELTTKLSTKLKLRHKSK